MTVLACDPDELESTAAALRRVAAELVAAADDVAGATVHDWSGAAAAEQAGRRSTAAGLLRSLATPVEELAGGLARAAGAAREEGAVVRQHQRLAEEGALERKRLLTLGVPPEPVAAERWSARVAELEVERRWHESLVAEAERRFDATQQALSQLLDRARRTLAEPAADLWLLVSTVKEAAKVLKSGTLAVGSARTVARLSRARGVAGERTRHVLEQRLQRRLRGLGPTAPAWAARLPGVTRMVGIAGKAAPFLVAVDGGARVFDGGGYDGLRGGTTRVLGLGAVAGVGAAGLVAAGVVAAPVAGVVGAVGLGAVAVYQGWMIGNHVYDNREAIGRALSRTWSRGRAGVARMWERLDQAEEERLARVRREHEARRTRWRQGRRAGEGPVAPVAPGVLPPGVVPPGVPA